MQKIKIAYGFKTISIGRLTIFTGKIRIKTSAQFLETQLLNYLEHLSIYDCKNNCATISFETTNAIINNQLIAAINNVLCQIMHDRIDAKYNRKMVHEYEPLDYLPY